MSNREHAQRGVIWDDSTTSEPVSLAGFGPASVYVPEAFSGASLGVEVEVADDDWQTLFNSEGDPITITIDGEGVYVLPIDLFGHTSLRLVSDQTETCTGKLFLVT